jgi:phosphoribosyl-ATP pyrophosphohydrolase
MNTADILFRLEATINGRKAAASESSYVAALHASGLDAILKKIGEEATETILAAKGGDRAHLTRETADLLFHVLILLAAKGVPLSDVLAELERREGTSGHDEKKSRSAT